MNNHDNLAIKVFISTCVILALVQSTVTKSKNEELSNMKKDLSTLQDTIAQKELEIQNITSKRLEADAKLESDRNLMTEEINTLKEKIDNVNSYIETNLSALSKDIIEDKALDTITLIKDKDFKGLSKLVHPINGLILSSTPEIKISIESAIKKDTIANWTIKDDKKYTWGVFDGEGKEIELTLEDYYNLYIYDVDYLNKAEVTYNKLTQRDESKKINVYELYKEGIVVEYFYKGTEENNYVDWKSIYLCFEKYNNDWYLSGIVHS